jgi:hypothetical protein
MDKGHNDRCRWNGKQQPAFCEEVKVLIVCLIEEEGTVALLIDDHGCLITSQACPSQPKVANDAQCFLPDRRAAAGTHDERLFQTPQERRNLCVCGDEQPQDRHGQQPEKPHASGESTASDPDDARQG